MSYFPFWSLFRVLYGFLFLVFFFFLCRSCLVLEQTCIYFQCKFCKWKKTKIKKNNARRDKSAVFMGNKEFFPDGCAF